VPSKIPESVLVVIHTRALEVLLIERADHAGYWQSVTGSKDTADEPLVITAAREVAEETGIVVGSTLVPQAALIDWAHAIDYEIYPIWRHRYAPGVVRNTEQQAAAERCFSASNRRAILELPQRLGLA
jgi:dATP pyrophosphohydrolase